MPGPLEGVVVTELAGLGPAPFTGMLLADLGARVVRIDKPPGAGNGLFAPSRNDLLNRGKESVALDLKTSAGVEVAMRCVERSDVLLEGFRPGVVERLGIGPADCLARNPSLVYGRVTGWGQDGPRSGMAGHDIDYIALSGALHPIGPMDRPVAPLNLVGDFGGGGMLLAVGVLAAIVHARAGGVGQVVDAAMTDGSALLTTSHHGFIADGWWAPERSSNLLDGGAPFYGVYETSDGLHVAVGALEPQFFAALLEGLGVGADEVGRQHDRTAWPEMRAVFSARFLTRTRDDWAGQFDGTDACVAPVLSLTEAPGHPHNRQRATFIEVDGVTQPAPAPRFSTTPARVGHGPPLPGSSSDTVLAELGYSTSDIGKLRESGAVF